MDRNMLINLIELNFSCTSLAQLIILILCKLSCIVGNRVLVCILLGHVHEWSILTNSPLGRWHHVFKCLIREIWLILLGSIFETTDLQLLLILLDMLLLFGAFLKIGSTQVFDLFDLSATSRWVKLSTSSPIVTLSYLLLRRDRSLALLLFRDELLEELTVLKLSNTCYLARICLLLWQIRIIALIRSMASL